jgi:dTDP-4-amino-4,6-dideoxygalactose transaminase
MAQEELSLPMYAELTPAQIESVVAAAKEACQVQQT